MKWTPAVLLLLLVGCTTNVRVDEVEMQQPAWLQEVPEWAEGEGDPREAEWVVTLDTRIVVGDTIPSAVTQLLGTEDGTERIISTDQLQAIEALADDSDTELFTTPRLMLANDQPGWLALTAENNRGLRMAALPEQVTSNQATLRYDLLFVKESGGDVDRWQLEGQRRLKVGDVLLRRLSLNEEGRAVLAAMHLREIMTHEAFEALQEAEE